MMTDSMQKLGQMITALQSQSNSIQTDLKAIGNGELSLKNVATVRHARAFCFDAKQIILPRIEALVDEANLLSPKAQQAYVDLRNSLDTLDQLSYRKGKAIDLADGMLAPFSDDANED